MEQQLKSGSSVDAEEQIYSLMEERDALRKELEEARSGAVMK